MSDYTIKSEEEKRNFDSGAVRNAASGKGRFDLLPLMTIWDLAKHYEKGIVDGGYPDRNWEQGIPLSCFFDSAIRHAFEFFMGIEDNEDHLIAAIWNLVGLRETKRRIDAGILPKKLDDIPYTWKNRDSSGYAKGGTLSKDFFEKCIKPRYFTEHGYTYKVEDIAAAMTAPAGERVILNMIGKDLRRGGPLYKQMKAQG